MSILLRVWRALDIFFPEREIFTRSLSFRVLVLLVVLSVIFSLIAMLIPADGFFAYDWVYFFGIGRVPPFYPPWDDLAIRFLTYPLLVGITLAAFIIAVMLRAVHPVSAAAAALSLPLVWTIFLGQLEGLVILGLLGLPWLVPLALIKPQVALFALGARRSYLLAFFAFLLLSLFIWGNWPAAIFTVQQYYPQTGVPQNIGLGWYGLPLFLLTIWFSRGDMDMLMASGSFLSPHLIVYNLLPLTPAVARLKPASAMIALLFSYATLLANWIGPRGWYFGWVFILWLWLSLAARRYPGAPLPGWLRRLLG